MRVARPVAAVEDDGPRFVFVDLGGYYNNDGVSHPGGASDGDLNGEGMAFPAEVLPPSNQTVVLCGIPFMFPDIRGGIDNNVRLAGQRIKVQAGSYSVLHILGVSEGGSFEEPLVLQYGNDRRDETCLGLTNCRSAMGKPLFGEQAAIRFDEMHFPPGDTHTSNAKAICALWLQTLAVDQHRTLTLLELGDNECMHIFAATLRQGCPVAEESGT